MDSEELEVQKQLEEHGLGDLPMEYRTVQGVEDALIDKLNADAVRELEKRAKAAKEKVKGVLDMYPHGVG